MEIYPDILIQITEMGQFIPHSLNMKHLLVTSLLQQQIHLKTVHCKRQPVTFFYLYIKTTNQSGNQAQTVVQKHEQKKNVLISYRRTPI